MYQDTTLRCHLHFRGKVVPSYVLGQWMEREVTEKIQADIGGDPKTGEGLALKLDYRCCN